MKKGLKKLAVMLLAGFLCLASFGIVPAKAEGSGITHGNVQIIDVDYGSILARLKAKYPSVFPNAKVYKDGEEVGTENAVRVLFTRSATHLQAGNQGPTEVFINGAAASTVNGAFGLPSFLNNEAFTVNGKTGYCFDWLTPSRTGQHVPSATLAEAGISVREGVDVIGLAEAARMLTQDSFSLIADNAETLAMSVIVPATAYNGAVTIPKEDVAALLRDSSDDATAFKRGLVQMMVWGTMNGLPYSDYMYYFISASGYWDKEGGWHDASGTVTTAPVIGITGFIDFPKMYEIGYLAYQELKTSADREADWEREYELTVGEPFSIPSSDVENIKKILDKNGGKIDQDGMVKVVRSADGKTITLTAEKELSGWTEWQGMTEDSSMIYSSKPYSSSYNDAGGSRVFGSGQFVVDVNAVRYYRVRIRASAPPKGSVTVIKTSEDGRVEGVSFKIEGPVTVTKKTDASGRVSFEDLTPGDYTVSETDVPFFYVSPEGREVTVGPGETELLFHNALVRGTIVIRKECEDGTLKGFAFRLKGTSYGGTEIDKTAVSDESGAACFEDVPYGEYTVTEEMSEEQARVYVRNEPVTLDLRSDEAEACFLNRLIRKKVRVVKSSEDGRIEGIVFHLYGKALNGTDVDEHAETNAQGVAEFGSGEGGVLPGNYVIEEVNVPEYMKDPGIKELALTEDTSVSFMNTNRRGSITVEKRDAETKELMTGCLFGVYEWDGESFVFLRTMKDEGNGTYTSGELVWTKENEGRFTVRELSAPDGYFLVRNDGINEFSASFQDDTYDSSYEAVNMKPAITTKVSEPALTASEDFKITDTVFYKNLLTDRTYTVRGVLMDRETGEEVKIKGRTVTAETVFTPAEESGSVDVVFEFDATLLSGRTLVVFESLVTEKEEGLGAFEDAEGGCVLIASHKDLLDEDQTFEILEPLLPPETGDTSRLLTHALTAALSLSAFAVLFKKTVKKE